MAVNYQDFITIIDCSSENGYKAMIATMVSLNDRNGERPEGYLNIIKNYVWTFHDHEAADYMIGLLQRVPVKTINQRRFLSHIVEARGTDDQISIVVKKILENVDGIKINLYRPSALEIAMLRRRIKVAKLLVEHGADIEVASMRYFESGRKMDPPFEQYILEVTPLHHILKRQTGLPLSEYRKYFLHRGCVRVAQLGGGYEDVQAVFNSTTEIDVATGLPKKSRPI